jgi:hypothetical protein
MNYAWHWRPDRVLKHHTRKYVRTTEEKFPHPEIQIRGLHSPHIHNDISYGPSDPVMQAANWISRSPGEDPWTPTCAALWGRASVLIYVNVRTAYVHVWMTKHGKWTRVFILPHKARWKRKVDVWSLDSPHGLWKVLFRGLESIAGWAMRQRTSIEGLVLQVTSTSYRK